MTRDGDFRDRGLQPFDRGLQPFDRGLQPERTLLAWRRTCLSFAIGCAVAIRFAAEVVGVLAAVAGLIALGLVIVAYVGASRRYRRLHHALMAGQTSALPGGSSVAVFAVAALLVSVIGFVIVIAVSRG